MKIISIFLILLLTGCAPKCKECSFWNSGYQETNLNDHEFILTFKEGVVSTMLSPTSLAERDRIMAMRAAELTLENGYSFFDIKRGNTMSSMHISCYKEEETETSINAVAFLNKHTSSFPLEEHVFELTGKQTS